MWSVVGNQSFISNKWLTLNGHPSQNFTPASSPPPPEGAGVRSLPAPPTNAELTFRRELASIPTELADGRRLVLTMEGRGTLVKASKLSVPVYCNNRHKSPNRKGRAAFACVLCFPKDRCAGERVGIEDDPNSRWRPEWSVSINPNSINLKKQFIRFQNDSTFPLGKVTSGARGRIGSLFIGGGVKVAFRTLQKRVNRPVTKRLRYKFCCLRVWSLWALRVNKLLVPLRWCLFDASIQNIQQLIESVLWKEVSPFLCSKEARESFSSAWTDPLDLCFTLGLHWKKLTSIRLKPV